MTSSYQHSHPGQQLQVDMASADENDPLYSGQLRHPVVWKNKRVLAVTALGILLMAFVAVVSHSNPTDTTALLIKADATGPPDYNNKETTYNWQKCMESDDPDCWMKEGQRVGHWWKKHVGGKKTTTSTLFEADAAGPPDYNSKEGQYDWQKCMESNDPDCWKKEGQRVGQWWSSLFGGEKATTSSLIEADAAGPPDYSSKEGQYDWQKCMEANDPACWMKEGQRVGNWWKKSVTTRIEADAAGPPDYNSKEGQYDWQKCRESNDPDCWEKEGHRVGHWWQNFGMKMRNWWSSLFGRKTTNTEETTKKVETADKVKSTEKTETADKVETEQAETPGKPETTEEAETPKTKAKKHKSEEAAAVKEPKL